MATGHGLDLRDVSHALEAWARHHFPDRGALRVAALDRASAGWTNEILLVRLDWDGGSERLVFRVPAELASFPDVDPVREAHVHDLLRAHGVPAPAVVAVERDVEWLGTPFLVLAHAAGRAPGDAPGLDPWLTRMTEGEQRAVQDTYLAHLARAHHVETSGWEHAHELRAGLGAELRYWAEYLEWATDGDPPSMLVDALDWCGTSMPKPEPPHSLLWGDARLGNVLFDDTRAVDAMLDWECASIGPAEMDYAWYLALDALTTKAVGAAVPGFLAGDALRAACERALGRAFIGLQWHEIFALVRSTAVSDRQARLAAQAGTSYPGSFGNDTPMLQYVHRRIARYTPDG